eukprot:5840099-Pleurochrysis_carterae.AAC.1
MAALVGFRDLTFACILVYFQAQSRLRQGDANTLSLNYSFLLKNRLQPTREHAEIKQLRIALLDSMGLNDSQISDAQGSACRNV